MSPSKARQSVRPPKQALVRMPAPDADPVLPPLQERVTFHIHRVNAMLALVCNPIFLTYDIDLVSSRILVALLERPPMRVGDLVALMVLPQSTISHQLQRLQRRALIERTRTAADNRAVAVTLTATGRRTALVCSRLSRQVYQALASQFSVSELATLKGLLMRMFEGLETLSAAGLDEPVARLSAAGGGRR
jgi:MarR family transcriptional regulator, organic hydroperoxide resistance regulator